MNTNISTKIILKNSIYLQEFNTFRNKYQRMKNNSYIIFFGKFLLTVGSKFIIAHTPYFC